MVVLQIPSMAVYNCQSFSTFGSVCWLSRHRKWRADCWRCCFHHSM